MNTDHLIQMANQIGTYFSAEPDPVIARAGVAEHLTRFWERRMRESIYACLDSGECDRLSSLVAAALIEYRDRLLTRTK